MPSRRNFLATVGLASGAAVLGGTRLSESAKAPKSIDMSQPIRGERYAGFVILPQGAPIPEDVRTPERPTPILCQAGEGGSPTTGHTASLTSAWELKTYMEAPTFLPFGLGSEVHQSTVNLIRYNDGEVYAGVIGFESWDARLDQTAPNIRLEMNRYYPTPVPLWESTPVASGEPYIQFHRVDFLPAPGVMNKSGLGHIFHWIQGGVYYKLYVENSAPFNEARRIVRSFEELDLPSREPAIR